MQTTPNKKGNLTMFWIFMGVLGRLVPHPANVTPLVSLSLFAGTQFSKKVAYLVMLLSLLASDAALAYCYGYPIFSAWSLFTYTGFATIILLGNKLANKHSWRSSTLFLLCSSFGFWLWTNFGVWVTSSLYPKTLSGLATCYTLALPFLRNELIGDSIWFVVIFGGFYLVNKHKQIVTPRPITLTGTDTHL